MNAALLAKIKANKATIIRRAYIKRRILGTGLYESDWQEISDDVKTWGKVRLSIDEGRPYKFKFDNAKLVMQNDMGTYNPEDNEASMWYGYLNQQRTLVKLEAAYLHHTLAADGYYRTIMVPNPSNWDDSLFDVGVWDDNNSSSLFTGVISGDIILSDKNEVTFNIKPLISVFQDFPARNLTGWTSTGFTGSQFITFVMGQTDGAGEYIFRPFFGNTTSGYDVSTTSVVFGALNTSTAEGVFDQTVWQIIEKIAEADNFVPYVSKTGTFKYVSRNANTTTSMFEFHGAGSPNSTYGHTIKHVSSFGRKISKYYSRVQVQWRSDATTTSYEIVQATFAVSPSSNPWVLGHKTFDIQNTLIPTSTVAQTIAQTVYNEVSTLKNEIDFTTSFIPNLDILDRCSIYYDPSELRASSLWDQRDWGDDLTDTITDLIFDNSAGDAIKLSGDEFKFLAIETDLDKMENRFIARGV